MSHVGVAAGRSSPWEHVIVRITMANQNRRWISRAIVVGVLSVVAACGNSGTDDETETPESTTVETRVKNGALNWSITPPTSKTCRPIRSDQPSVTVCRRP